MCTSSVHVPLKEKKIQECNYVFRAEIEQKYQEIMKQTGILNIDGKVRTELWSGFGRNNSHSKESVWLNCFLTFVSVQNSCIIFVLLKTPTLLVSFIKSHRFSIFPKMPAL